MRRLLDVLYRAFPIRNCYIKLNDDTIIKKGLGIQTISESDYHEMIDDMILFLKGETKTLEKKLAKQMKYFSSKLMYEDSARVRDQIKAIKSFKRGQRNIVKPIKSSEIK